MKLQQRSGVVFLLAQASTHITRSGASRPRHAGARRPKTAREGEGSAARSRHVCVHASRTPSLFGELRRLLTGKVRMCIFFSFTLKRSRVHYAVIYLADLRVVLSSVHQINMTLKYYAKQFESAFSLQALI